ncbi:MAG: hypothetical protein EKK55_01015 [Rhodocyclaceae bacterium]|nr:MAG: hypothetical protein EKK55_01015 [Rhodocyclaceae bacterium]
MRTETRILLVLACVFAVLACASTPQLDMDANGNALLEVLERHDRMLTLLEKLEANGQLEQLDPTLSPPEFPLWIATWRTQSEILALAASRAMVTGEGTR